MQSRRCPMIDPNLLLAARRLCVAHDALISSHPTGELRIEFFSARDAFSKELRKEFRANSPWLELYAAMRALIIDAPDEAMGQRLQ
jgi:hypothetical protein